MVHVLGAALAAAGAAWLGFRGAAALSAQVRDLRDLEAALALLAQELALDAPPLPALLERLIPRSRGPAVRLFRRCRAALSRLAEEDFPSAWTSAVEELDGLPPEAKDSLLPLGAALGRCGWEDQRRAAEAVRARISELAARAGEDSRRRGRVCRALGLSGGAFLVILLL